MGVSAPASATGPAPARRARQRTNWLAAIAVAALVHGAAFFLMGVSSGHRAIVRHETRGAKWVGERTGPSPSAVDEAIDLFDPSTLFLPTRHNVATRIASGGDGRGPGEIFPEEDARLSVSSKESPPGLVVVPPAVPNAGAAIRRFTRPYFSAFGQQDERPRRLTARAGLVQVRSAQGEVVMTMEVPLAAADNVGAWPMWAPFEIILAVEPTGTLGPPLVPAPGSGAEVVDEFFRGFLRSGLRGDLRLPAGYYRVVVGP